MNMRKRKARPRKESLSPRERFLIAMRGGKPDRVPATPDFSNMIPCRLTGKPFWDIYLHNQPPLWRAYIAAAEYFGIDAWFSYGSLEFKYEDTGARWEHRITSQTDERIVQRSRLRTPDGDMECETTFYRADPPTPTEKLVKDLAGEFPKVRHLFPLPLSYDAEFAKRQKAILGERQAFGTCVGYPGFQSWMCWTQGGVEPLAYAEMDCPHLLEEIREMHERQCLKQMEMILDSNLFDYVLLGGSGSITLASPE
ncbi:MAG: hypothetical protein N3A66_06480, partial [Planctomycetota bacterium]|nr:hypothetical protein [Planctomycetota bacterium]